MIIRRIAAPSDAVLAAATARPIATGFADPIDPRVDGSAVTWTSGADVVDRVERVASILPDGDGCRLEIRSRYRLRIPYFRWFFAPLVRGSVRASLERMADVISARAEGRAEPPAPRRPFWTPRDRMSAETTSSVAAICAVLLVAGFGSALFTQTLDFVATSFDATDANLGVALALTRLGTFVGLAGGILADRRGRRRILLASIVGVCIATTATALAPNLATFTALQVLVRGFVQVASIVGFVAITEEAPEGSRAFLLAVAGMATGAGFAVGAGLLPLADLGTEMWRVLFGAGALGLLLVPGIARTLPETGRFTSLSDRATHARSSELVDSLYGGRFAIVAAMVFLLGFFGSPSLQFTNRYLSDVHGFSAGGILLLRSLTQGAPALLAILIGGHLAESHGRKTVASRATLVLALGTAAFFLLGGPALWTAMLLATVAGALSGPSMTAFTTELFPTEVRGRAGSALLIASVSGAVAGLLLVGYLADPLGDVGRAIAVTCLAPVLVALFLIPRLPEARGRALDEVSPPEV
jgi:MFS transporter, putative metabolite:H+ symporter